MRKHFSFYVVLMLLFSALSLPGIAHAQLGTAGSDLQAYQAEYDKVYQELSKRMLNPPKGFAAFATKFDTKITNQAELDEALKQLIEAAGVKRLDKTETQAWQARRISSYVGLGLSIEPHHLIGSQGLLVSEVIAESTAEEAGLKANDWILTVEGNSISGLTDQEVVDQIVGEVDSHVIFTVQRDDGVHNIKVRRDIDGKIGVELENAKPFKTLKVRWLRDDGPAAKAGLKDGHVITFIDGKSTEHLTTDDALKLLRLPFVGDTVPVTIIGDDGEQRKITLTTEFVSSWDLAMSMQSQYGGDDLYYNNFTLGIKSFDYELLPEHMNGFVTHTLKHNDGGIIDMVGATGSNAEVAAIFLASFYDGETELLRLKERVDGQEVVTVYKLTKDREILVERNGSAIKLELDEKPTYYGGKLVVVIDSKTSGVAEAVAQTLQRTGRASLVGDNTAGNAVLKSRFVLNTDLALEYDSGLLLNADGSNFTGVKSDRSFFIGEDQLETARKELGGRDWYNSFDNVTMLVLIGIVGFLLLVFARASIRASREDADAERIAAQEANAAIDEPDAEAETTTDADGEAAPDEAESDDHSDKKSGGGSSKSVGWFALLALLAIAAVAFTVVSRLPVGPEDATNGKIVVEFFTDGSVMANKQKAIVDQLASEYSGDIEFKTIEIANNPYAGKDDWRDVDKPVVIVSVNWYDDSGKRVSGHSSKRYLIPKRELVPLIERSADGTYQKGLPELNIKRVRP